MARIGFGAGMCAAVGQHIFMMAMGFLCSNAGQTCRLQWGIFTPLTELFDPCGGLRIQMWSKTGDHGIVKDHDARLGGSTPQRPTAPDDGGGGAIRTRLHPDKYDSPYCDCGPCQLGFHGRTIDMPITGWPG